jgi:hypothetical protein
MLSLRSLDKTSMSVVFRGWLRTNPIVRRIDVKMRHELLETLF